MECSISCKLWASIRCSKVTGDWDMMETWGSPHHLLSLGTLLGSNACAPDALHNFAYRHAQTMPLQQMMCWKVYVINRLNCYRYGCFWAGRRRTSFGQQGWSLVPTRAIIFEPAHGSVYIYEWVNVRGVLIPPDRNALPANNVCSVQSCLLSTTKWSLSHWGNTML